MKRTSMTRDEQERWAVEYLAANLAREEIEDAESSITVQAFADFFAAQWPRTFNKMHFAAMVRQQAQQAVPQGIGSSKQEPSVQMFDRLFTLPGGNDAARHALQPRARRRSSNGAVDRR
jgi:TorA maturation chaperone TorD